METPSAQDFAGIIPYRSGPMETFGIYAQDGNWRPPACKTCSRFADDGHLNSPYHRKRAAWWIAQLEERG
eukprot:9474236-Lingulodinium_polyedra.AAC.1